MATYLDIANITTWAVEQAKTHPIWQNNKAKTFIFIGDDLESDKLFQNICYMIQCAASTVQTDKIDFGIIFTQDELSFFQTGKSDRVNTILYSPSLYFLRTNGALKKTLWQYFGNLGMI